MKIKVRYLNNKLFFTLLHFLVLSLVFSSNLNADPAERAELTPEIVAKSSVNYHPLVKATETELDQAEGELLTSQGAFDPVIKGAGGTYATGDYTGSYYGATIEQPLEFMGSRIFAGYREGGGSFPIYENEFETNDDGESRVGFELPLLRDSDTDRRRTNIQRNILQKVIASNNIEQRKIELTRASYFAFFEWASANIKLKIFKNLVKIAEERDQQLRTRQVNGDIPEFDVLDNMRAVLQRRSQEKQAQAVLRKSEFELSLLLRDESGSQINPEQYSFPSTLREPDQISLNDKELHLNIAKEQRPELKRIRSQIDQLELELKLNDNQRLIRSDLFAQSSQDFGTGSTSKDDTETKLGIKFEIPLRFRTQDGRESTLSARSRELSLQKEFLLQRISTDILDALTAYSISQERFMIAKKEAKAAEDLENGERKRLELGDSNLIFVNIRELTTADAKIRVVDSIVDLWRAKINLNAAKGYYLQ